MQLAYLAIVQPFESRLDMTSAVTLLVANGAVSIVCSALLGRAAPEAPSDADMLLVDQLALAASVILFADLTLAIGMTLYEHVTTKKQKPPPAPLDPASADKPLLTMDNTVLAPPPPRHNPLANHQP